MNFILVLIFYYNGYKRYNYHKNYTTGSDLGK